MQHPGLGAGRAQEAAGARRGELRLIVRPSSPSRVSRHNSIFLLCGSLLTVLDRAAVALYID